MIKYIALIIGLIFLFASYYSQPLMVIAALALGVALGVWLHENES